MLHVLAGKKLIDFHLALFYCYLHFVCVRFKIFPQFLMKIEMMESLNK